MIDLQQEAILFNLKASLFTQTNQLEAMQQIIQKDDEIIEKRKKVTATASSQMENGKITVVNYLSQLNAQLQAELNKKVHEIKQMNTISSMNATKGIITF
jgi:phage tail tape-measure protein